MGLEMLAQGVSDTHDDVRDVGMTYWQHEHDKEMQARQHENQMALNSQMAKLSADARRDSVPAMVEGLKRAGLHPVLASGTSFGSVTSGGSSSAPSSGAVSGARGGLGTLALESLRYSQSERGLMDAQKRNLDAEAKGREIVNQNLLDANDASNRVARDYFTSITQSATSSGEEKAFARAMLSTPLSVGALQGYDKVMESYPKSEFAIREKLKAQVEEQISASQLWDKDFAPKVAGMQKDEVDKLREQTKNLAANSALLDAELSRTKQDTEFIKKQQELVNAQIAQIYQTIRASKHSDLIGLLDSGEYLNFAVGLGLSVLPSAVHAVGGIGAARTLTRGRSANPAFMQGLAE